MRNTYLLFSKDNGSKNEITIDRKKERDYHDK